VAGEAIPDNRSGKQAARARALVGRVCGDPRGFQCAAQFPLPGVIPQRGIDPRDSSAEEAARLISAICSEIEVPPASSAARLRSPSRARNLPRRHDVLLSPRTLSQIARQTEIARRRVLISSIGLPVRRADTAFARGRTRGCDARMGEPSGRAKAAADDDERLSSRLF